MQSENQHYRRVVQGKRNRVAGKRFEDYISAACRYYAETGEAYIQKHRNR